MKKKMSLRNTTPASSYTHSSNTYKSWIERDFLNNDRWLMIRDDDFYLSQIAAPEKADAALQQQQREQMLKYNKEKEDSSSSSSIDSTKPLREKNFRKNIKYVHVPHKDKPPQVVAKRNARERRRVQAVNSAFVRLRKVVPIDNSRGKRISKVKTLHYAIEYIHQLEDLLRKHGSYEQFDVMLPNYCYDVYDNDGFPNGIEFDDDEV